MRTALRHLTVGITRRSGFDPRLPALPFSYKAAQGTHGSLAEVLRSIPPQAVLFCDANVFSERFADLVRHKLLNQRLHLVPHVMTELESYRELPSRNTEEDALKRILFPSASEVHHRLLPYDYRPLAHFQVALAHYVNLLLIRKRVVDEALAHARHTGKSTSGRARHAIGQGLARVSQRTLQLASKGAPSGVVADEELAVTAVIHAIVTGQPSYVLSADRDVFEQWFKFTGLLFNDYASMLIARDVLQHPNTYGPRLELTQYKDVDALVANDGAGSFAFQRPGDPSYLFPRPRHLVAMGVVYLAPEPEVLEWIAPIDPAELLETKEATGGRNTTLHDGRNCYGDLRPTRSDGRLPTGRSYAFVVRDRPHIDAMTPDGRAIHVSKADAHRAIWDIEELHDAPQRGT